MASETENLKLDLTTVQAGVSAVLDDPAKGKYWLAELEGKVVGCLLTIPEWSDWRNGTVLWIHSVYVEPSFRKIGIFKNLYSFLKTMVESSPEFRGLRLYVDRTNLPAQSVYQRLGMSSDHYLLYEWMKV
jgi:GNAT superfamily N-acetyltransferase